MISRRGFLTGIIATLSAPAIVRASSLMQVRAIGQPQSLTDFEYFRDKPWISDPIPDHYFDEVLLGPPYMQGLSGGLHPQPEIWFTYKIHRAEERRTFLIDGKVVADIRKSM